MSSSTERKNRQNSRANGTDRKTMAAREAAAKKKKENTKWTIVAIAVVLFIAATVYLNSGMFYRNTAAVTMDNTELTEYNVEAGSTKFSIAEVNYAYNTQLMTILSYFGDYASYMGLDVSQPLSQQPCSMGVSDSADEDYTWDDYFMDAAYTQLKETAALCAYAKYKGITLDDEDMAAVEENIASISETAKSNGYPSAKKFLSANYGTGCSVALVREALTRLALAAKVETTINDSFDYTDKQLADKYASVADSYDLFTYSYYFVEAETTEDAEGNQVASDEALTKANATAEEILTAINEGTDFAAATKDIIGQVETTVTADDGTMTTEMQDAAPTEGDAVSGSELPGDISKWLLDSSRKKGDTDIVKTDLGCYVVRFTERDNNQQPNEESGDKPACDFIADNLLRGEDLSKWREDELAKIIELYTTADRFAIKYVGR